VPFFLFFSAIVAILSYHISSSTPAHTERNPTKKLFSEVVRKRETRVAVCREDCSSHRMSSKLALPAQVCTREDHIHLPCPHFHSPFEEKAGFGTALQLFSARSPDEPGDIPFPCPAM